MNDLVAGIITVTLLILLLIAGIFMALSAISRQRLQQEKNLAENKLTFEREMRVLESEVSERTMTRLAYELHDNIGQLLTATHIQLENQKLLHSSLAESFQPIETYLSEATHQLRALSRTLNNDFIQDTRLVESIQLETDRLRLLKRFEVHYSANNTETILTPDEELMVFRIFQEITQNVIRHAEAKNVYVSISNTEEQFEFCVEDDGLGFDMAEITAQNRASGVRNMGKRAELASMECEIVSVPNEGTKIVLKKKLPKISGAPNE